MGKYITILGALLVLSSCASAPTGNQPLPDWQALESEAATTQPLQLAPEVEIYNLRIPLFYNDSPADRTSRIVFAEAPYWRAFGVDLGNALAIDAAGNVFLDVIKLLHVDTTGTFALERKPAGLGGRISLTGNGTQLALKSPHFRGVVKETEKGIALQGPGGKEGISVTRTDEGLAYKSTVSLDPNLQLKKEQDQLVVTGTMQYTAYIAQDGESVIFNSVSDVRLPHYVVTKQGDSYSIRFQNINTDVTYKIYFTPGAVYLTQNGQVATTVIITDSSILVNGRQAVTYTHG